jgi:hypothetical protein
MKDFIAYLFIIITTMVLWSMSKPFGYVQENYITQTVLDTAQPINVTIDVDFVKSLDPAYERSN